MRVVVIDPAPAKPSTLYCKQGFKSVPPANYGIGQSKHSVFPDPVPVATMVERPPCAALESSCWCAMR